MRKMFLGVLVLWVCAGAAQAQSEPATWGGSSARAAKGFSKPSGNANEQEKSENATVAQDSSRVQANLAEIANVVFTHRNKPDSPKPKTRGGPEDSGCPSGEGNPCALLGGRPYFRDQWHLTEHERSWWDAFKTPGMVLSTGMLFGATIVDIEGTQHCLAAGTCRELNPMMGKTRAQQYGVALPMNALLTWVAVREKQRGRGVLPFFMMWGLSSVHFYYGVNGLAQQNRH